MGGDRGLRIAHVVFDSLIDCNELVGDSIVDVDVEDPSLELPAALKDPRRPLG